MKHALVRHPHRFQGVHLRMLDLICIRQRRQHIRRHPGHVPSNRDPNIPQLGVSAIRRPRLKRSLELAKERYAWISLLRERDQPIHSPRLPDLLDQLVHLSSRIVVYLAPARPVGDELEPVQPGEAVEPVTACICTFFGVNLVLGRSCPV